MKIAEVKLQNELKEKRQLLVKDKERTEFRYQMPPLETDRPNSQQTLHSFYSKRDVVTEIPRPSKEDNPMKRALMAKLAAVLQKTVEELGQGIEEGDPGRPQLQITNRGEQEEKRQLDKKQRDKEAQDMKELCSEEYLEGLQKMVDAFECFEQGVDKIQRMATATIDTEE